jgi:NosR/NirI family nitrous oxide reductase transcriptional regulator
MPGALPRLRSWLLRLVRAGILSAVVLLIHLQHRESNALAALDDGTPPVVTVEDILGFFPNAQRLESGRVLGANDTELGRILQTAPRGDDALGYSGPTNTLVAFGPDGKVLGLKVLSSADTPEHLDKVIADRDFMRSFNGLAWEDLKQPPKIDGVTGATLTSRAIAEAIVRRAGGEAPSFRFPNEPTAPDVTTHFPNAASIAPIAGCPGFFRVHDSDGKFLGGIARTSPHGDLRTGYSGPSEVLIALESDLDTIRGLILFHSYDTAEYAAIVRDDSWFRDLFKGQTLNNIAALTVEQAGIEGVSGATMTSVTAARAVLEAARTFAKPPEKTVIRLNAADYGTFAVIVSALVIAFTSLRGKKPVRIGFQLVLIGYLGLTAGHLLSQSLFAGWARNGIDWRQAPGLVALATAALVVPLFSNRQIYCHHLCPHGAAQQLLRHRLPWQWNPSRRFAAILRTIPFLLLALILAAVLLQLPVNLAALEPFDAYLFRVAGLATLSLAILGLVASLFTPMAYCHYGCPTGAVLNFLWASGRADHWNRRDTAALLLLAFAVALFSLR